MDEEECGNINLKDYQNILSKYNAKVYQHEFIYGTNDIKEVEDSYFEDINDAIECANYLNSL